MDQNMLPLKYSGLMDPKSPKIEDYLESCKQRRLWSFTPLSYPPYIEAADAGLRMSKMLNSRIDNEKILSFIPPKQ